ncbi:MAG: cell division protein FtsQ/DivIB [Burkholderiales bacterium]|nr:cell division protein FtsQ/DivIB [Burkholderiales bacterium]
MNPVVPVPVDVKLMNLTAVALALVFVLLGAVAAARALARLSAFDIRAITVTGQVAHNNALTLRANVAPRLSGTFFSVDLARVRAAFEAAPWVRRAVVRRDFPNRLRVDLQEHQAVAYWGTDAEVRLLNSFGEVFEANVGEVEQDALPRLFGPDGQSAEVLAMYRALDPLFDQLELPLDQLDLSGGGSWRVRLDTGAAVELGRGSVDEIVARTRRFLSTLTQVASRYGRHVQSLESADLRHESGYAIRLRGVSTAPRVVSKK